MAVVETRTGPTMATKPMETRLLLLLLLLLRIHIRLIETVARILTIIPTVETIVGTLNIRLDRANVTRAEPILLSELLTMKKAAVKADITAKSAHTTEIGTTNGDLMTEKAPMSIDPTKNAQARLKVAKNTTTSLKTTNQS